MQSGEVAVDNGHSVGQWAEDSGSRQRRMDCGLRAVNTVGGGQGSGQWAVDSGQSTVDSKQ
jgi:hypothetical protein